MREISGYDPVCLMEPVLVCGTLLEYHAMPVRPGWWALRARARWDRVYARNLRRSAVSRAMRLAELTAGYRIASALWDAHVAR